MLYNHSADANVHYVQDDADDRRVLRVARRRAGRGADHRLRHRVVGVAAARARLTPPRAPTRAKAGSSRCPARGSRVTRTERGRPASIQHAVKSMRLAPTARALFDGVRHECSTDSSYAVTPEPRRGDPGYAFVPVSVRNTHRVTMPMTRPPTTATYAGASSARTSASAFSKPQQFLNVGRGPAVPRAGSRSSYSWAPCSCHRVRDEATRTSGGDRRPAPCPELRRPAPLVRVEGHDTRGPRHHPEAR